MDTPNRRDLFKYAVGATLLSALPVFAKNPKDTTCWSLVLDLTGPMGFSFGKDTSGQNIVNVWLPDLKNVHEHEAGIVIPGNSYPFVEQEYKLTGPPYSSTIPSPYLPVQGTVKSQIYLAQTALNPSLGSERSIHLILPMPAAIVALLPVRAKIYTGTTIPPGFDLLATGLRFLYDYAGTVVLKGTTQVIQYDFDPASPENQTHMMVDYTPINSKDDDLLLAKAVFSKLAMLVLRSDLKVNFDIIRHSPNRPCRAPIILKT
jgi:hypothetical protein